MVVYTDAELRHIVRRYLIEAGVRGPDSDFEPGAGLAKFVLTSVVRYFTYAAREWGVLEEYGAQILSPASAQDAWNVALRENRALAVQFLDKYPHFTLHAIKALAALGVDGHPEAVEHLKWLVSNNIVPDPYVSVDTNLAVDFLGTFGRV